MKTTRNMLTVGMMLAAIGLLAGSAHAGIVVTNTGTPTKVDNGSSTYTFSNWGLNGGNTAAVLFSGEHANGLTATYGGETMTVVEDTSGGRHSGAVAYLINPSVSTGDLVLSYTDTGGNESLYTPISLGNVGSVVASQARDIGNTLSFNYTTTLDGGFVLGAATNNDWNGGPTKAPAVSGNLDTFLYKNNVSSNFNTVHVYGDVATAGSYTDTLGGNPMAESAAAVAFEGVPTPPAAPLIGQLGILDLEANGGINPATGQPWKAGDQYRLAFHTSARTTAESTDIATYNAWVQGLADASTAYDIGASDGATWKAIGSTDAVDARDNTATNPNEDGTGHAIFLLDGSTIVASDYTDLWDGDIQNIIDLTELGTTWAHWPFTGSYWDGTEAPGHPNSFGALGDGGNIHQGQAGVAGNWIWRQWTGDPADTELPMYALSDPLTIREAGEIPEPASAALVLLGLGAVGHYRRRRIAKE